MKGQLSTLSAKILPGLKMYGLCTNEIDNDHGYRSGHEIVSVDDIKVTFCNGLHCWDPW